MNIITDTDNTAAYSGTHILQALTGAKKYNKFLVSLVLRCLRVIPKHECSPRILDAGSGIGTFAKILYETGEIRKEDIACFDPDPAQAYVSRKNGFTTESDLSRISDVSMDLIYSLNVIEHIEDDVAAIRDWVTKLKPGGRMLLYVPAHECLTSSLDRQVGHFRRYTRKSLTRTAESAGLRVTTPARYADCLGFFGSLAYKWTVKDASLSANGIALFDKVIFPISLLLDPICNRIFGKNVWLVAEKN